MPYAQQDTVAERLGQDVRKILRDRVEKPAAKLILDRWEEVRGEIAAHARGTWGAHGGGDHMANAETAKLRIVQFMDRHLAAYRQEAARILRATQRQAHDTQYLSTVWILDQITPPNVKVRPRKDILERWREGKLHESWAEQPSPDPKAEADGENRLEGWLKAWELSAIAGLTLGGVQGDDDSDAFDRIMGADADGQDMINVLGRLIQGEIQLAINGGDELAGDEFDDLLEDRIWTTMEDEDVCDECQENAGQSEEDVGEPPQHPWCRCWMQLIARGWQSLLDAPIPGLGARSMAFRDPASGDLVGYVTVEFDEWVRS